MSAHRNEFGAMNTAENLNRIFADLIDREAALNLLKGAVSCESITGNEANFVDFLQGHLARLKVAYKRADFLPGRPNIWGERKGSGGKRLLFIGHTDTVHVRGWQERWAGTEREDPFCGAVIDNEIWGRGTGDLKAGICSALAALELIDRAGIGLQGDVAFAFIGDEESGEPDSGVSAGVKDFTRRVVSEEIEKPDFAIYVEPTKLAIFPAQMGFFIADVKITGKTAYFGVPEQGVDALKATHRILTALWAHSEQVNQRAAHELIGRAFVLVTEIKGGGYIAVPEQCSFSLIRKVLPDESMEQAVAELDAVIRGAVPSQDVAEDIVVEITYPAGRDHSHGGLPAEIEPTTPEVSMLSCALRATMSPESERGQIQGAPFWSEAPFLINQIGCPTVYCAPGDITNCHTLEERVNVDEYMAGIIAFAIFIASYCGVVER